MEPSPVQRAALLARLSDEPSLAARVTVVPAGAETDELPDRVGAVLAMKMIGHLRSSDRRLLWRRLADRLVPGAPLVLNLQPPARVEAVPEAGFASVSVGHHRYVGSGWAESDGPETVIWRMRYRDSDEAGTVVREVVAAYRWHVAAPE